MKIQLCTATLMALAVGSAQALTITENFETTTPGDNIPAGWTTIGEGGDGSYVTSDTGGVGGSNSGSVDWTGSNQNTPGVYLVNSGAAFDATQSITGSFDFYVTEDGNYSMASFIFGDILDGISGSSAGELLNAQLFEKTFGTRARLLDGSATALIADSNNNREIATNEWNSASFTWTPTSGTTGDLTFTWDGPSYGGVEDLNYTGFTFDSAEIYFGFGTGRSPGHFDNISFTGTEYVVPEPGSLALLGLGGMLIASRRRRG